MTEKYFQAYSIGEDAYKNFNSVCRSLGKSFIVIGGKTALSVSFDKLMSCVDAALFTLIDKAVYGTECCDEAVDALYEKYNESGADFIVGVGGGKALDTAKCTALRMGIPVVTVPTIASTCAACSALSVVYTKEHTFKGFCQLGRPAFHTFIDTSIIAAAPMEFLRAGVGDTLAKYYEVEFSARGRNRSFTDELGISISKMCNTPLFECAAEAVAAAKQSQVTDALERAALIIIVSTGMVSMLIDEGFNGAMAHALFYGLTAINGFEEQFRHGDMVGYCTAVQLILDKQPEEAARVLALLRNIGIGTGIAKRGINIERPAFDEVLQGALDDPDMRVIPYTVTADMIYDAVLETEKL